MQLYERVRYLANKVAKSQKEMAELLGLSQATFNGYLKESRQDNLWPLLPCILKLYPQISRDWLYFDEGDMLGRKGGMPYAGIKPDEKDRRITELEAELKEERQLNRELTRQVLKQTQDGKENEEL